MFLVIYPPKLLFSKGYTPLIHATEQSRKEVVIHLINSGKDLDLDAKTADDDYSIHNFLENKFPGMTAFEIAKEMDNEIYFIMTGHPNLSYHGSGLRLCNIL